MTRVNHVFCHQDMHATDSGPPSRDLSQDWHLTHYTQVDDVTTLVITRELITCDTDDIPIVVTICTHYTAHTAYYK